MIPDKQQPYKILKKKRRTLHSFKGTYIIICLIVVCGIWCAIHWMGKSNDNPTINSETSNTIENSLISAESNISTEAPYVTASNSKEYYSLSLSQTEELSDYFYYGGHSYKLFRLYDITGRDAIYYSDSHGGYLAHINDFSENEFIASTIAALGYGIVYFGYSDEQSEGNWYWIDGVSSSFVNWRSGEPNNEANMEHYALISPDGTWNDGKLERDSQSGVIILCEWDTLIENTGSAQHISDFRNHISSISSSSRLSDETYGNKTYVYSAEKAFDNDMSTCWSEGAEGYGVGEWITFSFDDVYEITQISLWNGLCTSEDLFYKNSRLHNVTVVLSDGGSYDFECTDGWENRNQFLSFGKNVETSSITIIIQSVFEGNKYQDTCISEISVS